MFTVIGLLFFPLLLSTIIMIILTFIHELGHGLGLFITKLILKFDDNLDIRYAILFMSGKTFSPLYQYLSDNKHKPSIRTAISLNTLVGFLFEFAFTIMLFLLVLFLLPSHIIVFVVLVNLIVLSVFSFLVSICSSDFKICFHPEHFVYSTDFNPSKELSVHLPIIVLLVNMCVIVCQWNPSFGYLYSAITS